MNLLHDKRDDEQQSPKPDFHEVTPPPSIDDSSPYEIPKLETPYPEGKANKKQTSITAFLVTLLLLIIVSAAAYFIFFKDALNLFNKTPEQQTIVYENQDGFVDPNESSASESDLNENTPPEQASVVESPETNTDVTQQQTREMPSQTVTGAPDGENAFSLIGTTVGNLQQIVSAPHKISTLFFDESTFWAEITAGDMASAENIYDSIKSNFSNVLAISSPKPTSAKFLLSGNFNLPIISSGQKVSGDDIRSSLRSIANQTGVSMQSAEIETSGSADPSVFAKVNGSLSQCGEYVEKLATLGWDVKVSKVIFTPATTNTMSLTLRFIVR